MDIDPEDVVPSGNPRRRGAVTIGGGVGNKDDTAASGEASTRKMSRKMSSNLKNIWVKMANSSSTKTDNFLEELEIQGIREKPQNLETLERDTLFSRDEIKTVYRKFKEECPNGVLTEEIFRTVFQQFFPIGDTSQYSHFVYNTFRRNSSGNVTFASFLRTLSVMTKGTPIEKVTWVFNLYDIDRDGVLSQHDLRLVLESMYFMVGKNIEVEERTIKAHVACIIKKMSSEPHGDEISRDDFLTYCLNDQTVGSTMKLYTCGLF